MRTGSLCVLGLLSLVGSAAFADDKPPSAKPDKKICRREEVIGSVIPAHICMTKAEWDQLAQQSKNSVDKFTSRSTGVPGSASNPMAAQ